MLYNLKLSWKHILEPVPAERQTEEAWDSIRESDQPIERRSDDPAGSEEHKQCLLRYN